MKRSISRSRAIAVIAAAPFGASLVSCASSGPHVAVGSKDFTEELIVGEMYAQLLEKAGFSVDRKMNLGGTNVAMDALQRGDIDLYPEYTGTALLNVLKQPPGGTAASIYANVKNAYAKQFSDVWLQPAPFNDSQALATTKETSDKFKIVTLSDLSKAAPQLRLGTIPDFEKRADGLAGLKKAYGGFEFKSIRLFDIGLKYQALTSGQVDVVVAFGTDGQIASDHLIVIRDDKKFWPTYQIAPVVRAATLAKYPQLAAALDKLAPLLTDSVMQGLNEQVDGEKKEPEDVATAFLKSHGLT